MTAKDIMPVQSVLNSCKNDWLIPTGTVLKSGEDMKESPKNNSFQEVTNTNKAEAVNAGVERGNIIKKIIDNKWYK